MGDRIYEYIVRHFLGSVSGNCKVAKTTVKFEIAGEKFSAKGKHVIDAGFTSIMYWLKISEQVLPNLDDVRELPVVEVMVEQGTTAPPDFLSESELVELMEKHGIGTDASISVHINNICERNYCQVSHNRTLVPTKLGIALVHGYHKILKDLVQPDVRASIEKKVGDIASGNAKRDEVVQYALLEFEGKFKYLMQEIGKMDELFEASFALPNTLSSGPGPAGSKLRTKCGKCRRYVMQ